MSLMIVALQLLLLILIAGSIVYYAWCAIATVNFFAARQETSVNCQPVSVLIPVCGVDPGAEENWYSFCHQDYENYEVVFGVMNPQDPAVPILEELVARNPHRARLIFCLEVRGINYQVSNLTHLLEAAQHEVVIFTDSDMRVTPDYLRTVTAPLADPAIGLVTCGYVSHTPKFPVAALGSLGRCIDNIPSIVLARSLGGGLDFAIGSTMATRKSALAQGGGLQSIVNSIGSDYLIGNMVANAGYRVELSPYVLEGDVGRESFQQLFLRELRWARTVRWNEEGFAYYGLAFTYGSVYCIPLLLSLFHPWAVILCLTTLAIRVFQAVVCIYSMGCPRLLRWIWLLPLRDLMSFVIFVTAAFGQTVYWRGRRLTVGVGGALSE